MPQGDGNDRTNEIDDAVKRTCLERGCEEYRLDCDHVPRLTTADVEYLDSLVARDNVSTREQMKVLWGIAVDVKDYR